MKYKIGTKFIPRGESKEPHTIVDVLTTKNISGEIVRQKYVTRHIFLGQEILKEYPQTTIDRSEILK